MRHGDRFGSQTQLEGWNIAISASKRKFLETRCLGASLPSIAHPPRSNKAKFARARRHALECQKENCLEEIRKGTHSCSGMDLFCRSFHHFCTGTGCKSYK